MHAILHPAGIHNRDAGRPVTTTVAAALPIAQPIVMFCRDWPRLIV